MLFLSCHLVEVDIARGPARPIPSPEADDARSFARVRQCHSSRTLESTLIWACRDVSEQHLRRSDPFRVGVRYSSRTDRRWANAAHLSHT